MASANSMPDLHSILADLARFAPPAQPIEPAVDLNKTSTQADRVPTPLQQDETIPASQSSLDKTDDPRLRSQSRSTASPKPIDPATITTWQEGLRCVTKIAAQNAQFAATIRRMMEDQRKNEMRWYAERQNLKQTQTNRANSSAQAQSILQSLSRGKKTTATQAGSVVDTEAELANLDRKIHAAQVDMEAAMTAELKALGVPFFGTDPSLVVEDREEIVQGRNLDDRPKWSPIVTETQLLELRRRMVGHLEDLYRD